MHAARWSSLSLALAIGVALLLSPTEASAQTCYRCAGTMCEETDNGAVDCHWVPCGEQGICCNPYGFCVVIEGFADWATQFRLPARDVDAIRVDVSANQELAFEAIQVTPQTWVAKSCSGDRVALSSKAGGGYRLAVQSILPASTPISVPETADLRP